MIIPVKGDRVEKDGTVTPYQVLIDGYKEKIDKAFVSEIEEAGVIVQLIIRKVVEFEDREKYAEIHLEHGINAMTIKGE